jgi:hypothetical protein
MARDDAEPQERVADASSRGINNTEIRNEALLLQDEGMWNCAKGPES